MRRTPLRALAAAAAASVAFDAWLDTEPAPPPVPVLAALDWTAHAAATALALRALPRAAQDRLAAPALAASVLVDLDHVPIAAAMLRGAEGLPRPRPHTSALPLALAAAGRPGIAFGAAVHLARDLFTGPGVAVAWPAWRREVRLPVTAEALVLAALVSAAWRRSR